MSLDEFTHNCRLVSLLPFVEEVRIPATAPAVQIELSLVLQQVLPYEACYLTVPKTSLTVIEVIQEFERTPRGYTLSG